jgi:hypothetical protein
MLKQPTIAKALSAMALITVAGSACVAGASERDRNPLHPGYYAPNVERAEWIGTKGEPVVPYQDRHNPLHPGAGLDTKRQHADSSTTVSHVDTRNPLHPDHQF